MRAGLPRPRHVSRPVLRSPALRRRDADGTNLRSVIITAGLEPGGPKVPAYEPLRAGPELLVRTSNGRQPPVVVALMILKLIGLHVDRPCHVRAGADSNPAGGTQLAGDPQIALLTSDDVVSPGFVRRAIGNGTSSSRPLTCGFGFVSGRVASIVKVMAAGGPRS